MQIDFLARRLKLPGLAVEVLGSDRTPFGIVAMLVSFAVLLGAIFFSLSKPNMPQFLRPPVCWRCSARKLRAPSPDTVY